MDLGIYVERENHLSFLKVTLIKSPSKKFSRVLQDICTTAISVYVFNFEFTKFVMYKVQWLHHHLCKRN